MSFVSFLKGFGLAVLKGVQIFEGIAPALQPAIQAVNPTVAGKLDTLEQMLAQGLTIESAFASAFGPNNATGPAKFAALVPQIQQIVLSSQFLVGKKVGDTALFTKAMQEYAQATADLLNSLQNSVNTTGSANAPAVPVANLPVPPIVPPVPKTP